MPCEHRSQPVQFSFFIFYFRIVLVQVFCFHLPAFPFFSSFIYSIFLNTFEHMPNRTGDKTQRVRTQETCLNAPASSSLLWICSYTLHLRLMASKRLLYIRERLARNTAQWLILQYLPILLVFNLYCDIMRLKYIMRLKFVFPLIFDWAHYFTVWR